MNESLHKYLRDNRKELVNISVSIRDCDEMDGCVIVRLTGYIDTYNTVPFQKQVMQVLDSYTYIIFDFTELTYLSSTGIGSFTEFLKKANLKGGDMAIYNIPANIQEVFTLLGFMSFFKHANTMEETIDLLKRGSMLDAIPYFPAVIECPSCGNRLNARKAGRFRCPKCRCILGITEDVQVYLA